MDVNLQMSTPPGVLFWSGAVVRVTRVSAMGRALGRAVGLAGALQAVLLLAAGPGAAGVESPARTPDLMVMVIARTPEPTRVALMYSRMIDEARLRAGIGELGERAGATVGGIEIQKMPLERDSREMGTGAEFLAPGLVRGETGLLPVGAVMRSLPDWERMRIVFMLDEGFPFSGPRDAAADGFVVRLVNMMEAYEYDVERMTGKVEAGGEAVPSGGKSAPVLPAVAIGAAPGLVLGWLLADRRGKGRKA